MYHGLLSRKANHYKMVLVYPDDFHTSFYSENYNEGQQYGDLIETSVFSQESLNLPQENSTSDLDDTFHLSQEVR